MLVLFALALAIQAAPDPAPVVAAERGFAAETAQVGINRGFTRWSVPDALMISGGQASTVREAFPDRDKPADEPTLNWWPNFAGIARSGDLGFTTGGVEVAGRRTGHYFTVWKRQSDGTWKWVYDGGSGASAADVPGPASEPDILPASTVAPMPPERAMAEVRETERALAVAARSDQKAAHSSVISDDARLYVAPRPPAIGRAAIEQALDGWPGAFDFGPTEGGGSSDAGDMVWTWGAAAWMREGQARTGHYVRLWQRRPEPEGLWVWKLVFAQLIPAPPPAATPPPPPAEG